MFFKEELKLNVQLTRKWKEVHGDWPSVAAREDHGVLESIQVPFQI